MTSSPTASSAKATQADKQVARDVRKALSKAPNFNVSNVFVKARGGAVTLSGSVPDGPQIHQAAEVANGRAGCNVGEQPSDALYERVLNLQGGAWMYSLFSAVNVAQPRASCLYILRRTEGTLPDAEPANADRRRLVAGPQDALPVVLLDQEIPQIQDAKVC